jgi:hypothetical protein
VEPLRDTRVFGGDPRAGQRRRVRLVAEAGKVYALLITYQILRTAMADAGGLASIGPEQR